eukprot:5921823-Amphidinium_carterae.2
MLPSLPFILSSSADHPAHPTWHWCKLFHFVDAGWLALLQAGQQSESEVTTIPLGTDRSITLEFTIVLLPIVVRRLAT